MVSEAMHFSLSQFTARRQPVYAHCDEGYNVGICAKKKQGVKLHLLKERLKIWLPEPLMCWKGTRPKEFIGNKTLLIAGQKTLVFTTTTTTTCQFQKETVELRDFMKQSTSPFWVGLSWGPDLAECKIWLCDWLTSVCTLECCLKYNYLCGQ